MVGARDRVLAWWSGRMIPDWVVVLFALGVLFVAWGAL